MQDAGNNAQNLFHAPLGLVHKQSSNLVQILATEVCILATEVCIEFNIPTFENGKNYSIRNEKTLFAQH